METTNTGTLRPYRPEPSSRGPSACDIAARRLGLRLPASRGWRGIATLLAAMLLAPLAGAHQMPNAGATGGTGGNTSSTKTLPSGLTTTFAVTGGNYIIFGNDGAFNGLGGPASAMYAPQFAMSNSSMEFDVQGTGCNVPANGTSVCNRGTLTVSFSRPVTNPVLHFGGLGGTSTSGTSITSSRAIHVLTGSSPAGATLTLLPGAVNMAVTGGNTVDVANPNYVGANCSTITAPATRLAGCGSVRVNGTVSSVTFRVDLGNARLGTASSGTAALEGYKLTVSVDEDFGDAPQTYDPTAGTIGAASHIVGALRLGATVDADNTTTQNPNTPAVRPSPNAVAAGADNNGANGDGADENGLTAPLPVLHTGLIGQTWTLTPSLGNVTAAARVCGWVDFNRNGVFDNPAERACTDVAAGATGATLNWTVPTATTAGRSYVRLRVSHDLAGVQNPIGRVDSGEVEDYMLEIKPAVRVVKQLSPAADAGRFDLQIAGTTFAASAGHNGTTDFRTIYHNSVSNAPDVTVAANIQASAVGVTAGELAAAGTTLANYSTAYVCQNGAGATVASGTGTLANLTLPASITGAGANGQQQAITCTFTNTRITTVRLQKALPAGRADASHQFALTISGPGGPGQVTTTGSGTIANGVAVVNPATPGSSYALSEAPSGMPNLADYAVAWSCANALAGGQTPSGTGGSFTLTPVSGDDLTCTFTNTLLDADISVTKTSDTATVVSGGLVNYTFAVTNAGPRAAHGTRLLDTPGAGLDCTGAGLAAPTCSSTPGGLCPGGLTASALTTSPGVAFPDFSNGASLQITLQCRVTASGL